eukprot:CAMPEP_0113500496 /NCGR_PEP_ID=MMETSP0014_2-20120614/32364_1 /TAXON_ID=2857 /ORGANISM="Nitzschia sp." /LENGTH=172 /DNA_ID=CAMNT_0000394845 /DNA_START=198 /DNA_END=713 /DNA_ORIENTATION=+ /assembly_acc=CAM_ASM_000159
MSLSSLLIRRSSRSALPSSTRIWSVNYNNHCSGVAPQRLLGQHCHQQCLRSFSSSVSSFDDNHDDNHGDGDGDDHDYHRESPKFQTIQDLFNPTETHYQLREMLRDFVQNEVEPQAIEYNRTEQFNLPLLKQLGDLGLLGLTVPTQYGGSGLDASAVCLVHEELSYSDPAFC